MVAFGVNNVYVYVHVNATQTVTASWTSHKPMWMEELINHCYLSVHSGRSSMCCSGDLFLEIRGYETSSEWIWYNVAALVGLFLVFMTLAYISLRLVKKEK